MSETVYKVFRIDNGELYSFIKRPEVALRYVEGEKTYPQLEHSKLLAFPFLSDAHEFLYRHGRRKLAYQIWECRAEGIVECLWVSKYLFPIHIQGFWLCDTWMEPDSTFSKLFDHHNGMMPAPDGTVACDWIMPIKAEKNHIFLTTTLTN